ncbi:MAG TPA: C1 family peptidase [Acholeplasma sp.]|nr:C1 family peptidase [Acholeplasma sp.]
MNALKTAQINEMFERYNEKPVQKVVRRALVKNSIADITSINERETDVQFKFSNDIETLPVTNQKSSGRCWLFAGLNVIRELVSNKLELKEFEFSQNYQAFFDKFEKINFFLESMDDFLVCDNDDRTLKHLLQSGIQDGGQWDMFVSLVEKYGVVPKEAMPETHASSNTAQMNRFINIKLRQYAARARALANKNKLNDVQVLKEQTLEALYGFLVTNFGVPPKTVNFEYINKKKEHNFVKNLTPLEFYKSFSNINLSDYVSVINSPTSDKPFMTSYTIDYLGNVVGGKDIKHLNLEMPRLIELTINQLKDKEVVWFGADVSFYGDRTKGVWDEQSYDYESTFEMSFEMTKAERLDYLQGQMNHAMVITGVNLIDDLPTKWKIQNSWGSDKGSKGYYLMSNSWFNEHTYQSVIHKKYLSKAELDAYNEKPIRLKPWDPMGSLAK